MPARSGASSSSMNTNASMGSSWLDGSPSRQSPNRRTPRKSPLKELYESPSRLMTAEFSLMLLRSDNDFNERLNQADEERAKRYEEQLSEAAQERQKVHEGGKLEIQRLILERELEQRRREDAQRQENQRLYEEKVQREAEDQRQRLEATRREAEAARQAAERQKQIQEADARVKEQKLQQEMAIRHQNEKAEKQAREAAAAVQEAQRTQQAQRAQQPPTAPLAPSTAAPPRPPASTSASAPGVEELHAKYLELHARMKKFRTEFVNEHKKPGNPLKGPVGDTRRNMRKRLGQVTTARKDSQNAIARLRAECFDKALQTPGPMIDVRPYIISQDIPPIANEAEAKYPALLLYAWICFEKSVIQQWNQEAASEEHTIIQELGLIAASLYSDPKYQWKGVVPLTDTLLAKLHRVCPMMFGISGNTTTKQGLARLGLDKYGGSDTNLNSYLQMATGVGAGYASLSLRQFSGRAPAVPMAEYWRAVASICNTPSEALYPGHLMCLKGLLRDFIKKFLTFYGLPGKAVVRRATRTLPDRAPKERPGMKDAADIIRTMPDTWKRTIGIDIDR